MTSYPTPEFARIEVRLRGKPRLRETAARLRDLAASLEAVADSPHDDATADFVAWGQIKTASQTLRGDRDPS